MPHHIFRHFVRIACAASAAGGLLLLPQAPAAIAQGRTPQEIAKMFPELSKEGAKQNGIRLRKLLPKIIGGVNAEPGEFPYQVSLMLSSKEFDMPAVERHLCGGSIVGDEWVITAAHCVAGILGVQKYYTIGAGSIDLNKVEEYELDGAWVHPSFDGETLDYDFAVIKVKNPFIDPAVDVVDKTDNQHINVGNPATITGWGVDESGNVQQILKKAVVKVVSRVDCNDADSYNGAVTARMICLGLEKGGKDTCYGDSGGPAVTPVAGGARVLFATTSWGEGCAQPEKFGVYGRLISVRSWINSIIPTLESRMAKQVK